MKKEILLSSIVGEENDMSTDAFFKRLVENKQDEAMRDVLAYVNQTNEDYTDDDIEDLLETREISVSTNRRMKRLYEDISEVMPYLQTHEILATSAVLFDDKGFNGLLDEIYKEFFGEEAPPTSLPFEKKLNANQKETFRKLHRILASYKKDTKDEKLSDAVQQLFRYYQKNMSPSKELMFCKSAKARPIKEFEKHPSCLQCAVVQEIATYIKNEKSIDNVDDLSKVLMKTPFIKSHISLCSQKSAINLMLMFTNASMHQFLTEDERSCYDELMERYGNCRSVRDIFEKFRNSTYCHFENISIVFFMYMYATRICSSDFEQCLNTTKLSKKDMQEMVAFAALTTVNEDMRSKEYQLILESLVFTYNRITDGADRQKKDTSQSEKALVEKYKRENQDLKKHSQKIEKELKSEKELRKKAEEEIQKTKKYYKHTQDKENRSLKRENEDLREQVRLLEEQIKDQQTQEPLEEISTSGTIQESGDLILNHGEEKDLWPDEEKELILDILNDKLPDLHEGTRRRLLVEDILRSNVYRGTHKIRRNNLKKTLRGFTNVNSSTAAKLKVQGFNLTKTKTHIKISFMDDPRYTVSMPSTGSDRRNGDNLASQISTMIF